MINMNPNELVIFGFKEFIGVFAIALVFWTFTDTKYKFRMKAAGPRLEKNLALGIFCIGLLTLLTDLWRAMALPLPSGPIPTTMWQAALAGGLLVIFVCWYGTSFLGGLKYTNKNSMFLPDIVEAYVNSGDLDKIQSISEEMMDSYEDIFETAGGTLCEFKSSINRHSFDLLSCFCSDNFIKAAIRSRIVTSRILENLVVENHHHLIIRRMNSYGVHHTGRSWSNYADYMKNLIGVKIVSSILSLPNSTLHHETQYFGVEYSDLNSSMSSSATRSFYRVGMHINDFIDVTQLGTQSRVRILSYCKNSIDYLIDRNEISRPEGDFLVAGQINCVFRLMETSTNSTETDLCFDLITKTIITLIRKELISSDARFPGDVIDRIFLFYLKNRSFEVERNLHESIGLFIKDPKLKSILNLKLKKTIEFISLDTYDPKDDLYVFSLLMALELLQCGILEESETEYENLMSQFFYTQAMKLGIPKINEMLDGFYRLVKHKDRLELLEKRGGRVVITKLPRKHERQSNSRRGRKRRQKKR